MKTFAFELKINNLYTLPADGVERLLDAKDPDGALLLLYLVRSGGVLDEITCKNALGFTDTRLKNAVRCLLDTGCIRELGVTAPAEPVKEEAPPRRVLPQENTASYMPRELSSSLQDDAMFRWLYQETEKRFGRMLKKYELESLYMIYDHLALPAEVILMLIGYLMSAREERLKKDPYAPAVTFRQITKEATSWCEMGIVTVETADNHIRKLQYRASAMGKAMAAVGIRDRLPSPGERNLLGAWIDAGASVELIAKAYDITVMQKGALHWAYMRSIVDRWLERGYRTGADVDAGEGKHTASAGGRAEKDQTSPVLDSEYAQRVRRHMEQSRKNGQKE